MEAALDLAGITKHVTVLEFLPELKADQVLQERAAKTDNLTILKNVATKEILGQDHVTGLSYVERDTNEENILILKVSLSKLVLYQVLLGSKTVVLNSMNAKKLSLINFVQQISLVFLPQVTVLTAPTNKSLFPWDLVLQLLSEPLIT